MTQLHPGDVVKYGHHDWQWGTVIGPAITDACVMVRRRNRIIAVRSAVEIVIPRRAWEGLCRDVKQGEPFTKESR